MTRARSLCLLLGLGLLLGSLVGGALRVQALLLAELSYEGPWQSLAQRAHGAGATRISARLAEVTLRAGELATFEVCAASDLARPPLNGALTFAVWQAARHKLELRVALDHAHSRLVKRAEGRSCLTLGGGRISESGRYALDAVWPNGQLADEVARLPLRARVLAKQPLGLREGLWVVAAALGAVICLLSVFAPRPAESSAPGEQASSTPQAEARPHAWRWAVGLGLLGAALFQALLRLPLGLVSSGVMRGLAVGAVELGLAVLGARLAFRQLRAGLCLFAPRTRASLWLLAAGCCAALLHELSHYCLRLVPRTGEAPIETYISWPSGALSFALVGMAVPLAEDLFFRGFVYGALRPAGKPVAWLGSFALFVLAHVQQVWGSWGALLSVALTGAVLTALRAVSGSTLVSALAHVLFNLSLWSTSFRG